MLTPTQLSEAIYINKTDKGRKKTRYPLSSQLKNVFRLSNSEMRPLSHCVYSKLNIIEEKNGKENEGMRK